MPLLNDFNEYPKLTSIGLTYNWNGFYIKRQLFKTFGKHILNDSQLSVILVTHIIEEMPLFLKKIYLKTFKYLTRLIFKML